MSPRRASTSPLSDVGLPPEHAESEAAVLGCALNEGRAFVVAVAAQLQPEDFYLDGHRVIFETMIRLADRGQPIDQWTVTADLQQHGHLSAVGGASALALLVEGGVLSIPENAPGYIAAIREARAKREGIALASSLTEHLRNGHRLSDLAGQTDALAAMLHGATACDPAPTITVRRRHRPDRVASARRADHARSRPRYVRRPSRRCAHRAP